MVQVVKEGAHLELETSEKDIAASLSFLDGGIARVLVNASGCHSVSRSARKLFLKAAEERFDFTALVTGDGLADVLGNFWLKLSANPSSNAIRLFRTEDEARAWFEGRTQ
ncbi:MAG: hypothetical protein ACPGU1_20635 [Myxococcota bacterium]